ncbi:MAG TPA: DUF3052 domain-containing protein [Nocardioides sp.]|uniref:DUF3052 domain-containing protein n=1 Tax=Nocardioides sp. TaxID=35761 RepID=UPI002CC7DAF6|nr:DUF3052 domain-containing protein [Nocardioides sp.]HQR27183.1 DUF3052 domain-containing protein [Nocardioides sp.]
MAGYSATPLPRKLGVTDGQVVLLDGVPDTVRLGDLGAAHVVRRLPAAADLVLTFHTTEATLRRRLPRLLERTTPAGAVWVCWPKKSARRRLEQELGVSCDLDENLVRALGLALGVVDVKVAAIDEVWSGLKLVRRLRDR